MGFKWTTLYNNKRWRRLRAEQLAKCPLCWYCQEAGKVVAADTVDHFKPHRGNELLFWDKNNLKSSCTPCHNHLAAVKDTTGIVPGCGLTGEPLDPAHPWYQQREGNA